MPILRKQRATGFGLVDLIVAISLVAVILTVTFFLLQSSTSTWRKVSGSQDAASQLLKAESWLRRDLSQASYQSLNSGDSLTTLVGRDGDAVWFLSATDPATGEFLRNDDGSPRWQRNILYYPVIPSGLPSSTYNGSGVDDGGYEVSHPAKLLIRKVIDSDVPTIPTDPSTQEVLLTDISSYLETPNGSSLSYPNSESASIVARDILSLRVARNDALESLTIRLQAAKLKDQQLDFVVGSRSLLMPGILLERRLEIYPENRG